MQDGCLSGLPVELLPQVLKHVEPQQLHKSCVLVSRAWNTAAVMSMGAIHIPRVVRQSRVKAVSDWLHAHAGKAQLRSIKIVGIGWRMWYLLTLPAAQHLTALRELHLEKVRATSAEADAGALQPVLSPALKALTRLELVEYRVRYCD